MIRHAMLAAAAILAMAPAFADSPLSDAIQKGRRDIALDLIAKGADVNAAQADGSTPLHWAAYKLDKELVRLLLDRGGNANAKNEYGSSPIAEAVKAANSELVKMFLDAGADVEAPNGDGETLLMLASRTGSTAVAKLLIDRGADVNAREAWRDQTALMWAAEGAYPELTQLLIDHGADVRARAAANDWGVQITSEPRAQYRPTGGLTPLLYAARAGCPACVSAIVAAGEDVDRPTPDSVTALMLAIDNLEFDTAKVLIDLGANPHISDWWGRTALYIAVDMVDYVPRTTAYPRSTKTPGIDIVRQLLALGVDTNTQLNMHRPGRGGNSQRFTDDLLTTGATPLLRAAITHSHDSMRALLEHGAIVDLPNVMGVTPLMAAAAVGVRDSYFGSNRSPTFDSDPLIEEKIITSFEILLAAGADINARITDGHSRTARIARRSGMSDREGQTALFSVAGHGWAKVTQFMIERGAIVDIADAGGLSPLDAALATVNGEAVKGSEAVAELLRKALENRTAAVRP
jgi:ankyrin repeat protein